MSSMVKAKFAYAGQEEDELSFAAGDLIQVLSKEEGDWWHGRLLLKGTSGMFPANYVETQGDTEPSTGTSSAHARDSLASNAAVPAEEANEMENANANNEESTSPRLPDVPQGQLDAHWQRITAQQVANQN